MAGELIIIVILNNRYLLFIEIIMIIMIQGVHEILCFFPKIFKYSGLWPFSVFPLCQCVYTHQAGRKRGCSRIGRVQKNHNILRKKHNI